MSQVVKQSHLGSIAMKHVDIVVKLFSVPISMEYVILDARLVTTETYEDHVGNFL